VQGCGRFDRRGRGRDRGAALAVVAWLYHVGAG
jgi:hypothetical protein